MNNAEAERAFHQVQNHLGHRYPALMKLIVAHADAEVVRDLYALVRDVASAAQKSRLHTAMCRGAWVR